MDEHNSRLSPEESAAALSAAALRELQGRTQSTLASSRQQAARLEAAINQKLDAIAAALDEQFALESKSSQENGAILSEVSRLTSEQAASHSAWEAERAALELQCASLLQEVNQANADRDSLNAKLLHAEQAYTDIVAKLTDLEVEREILSQRVTSLVAQSDDISPKLDTLETERQELAQQLANSESNKEALTRKVSQLKTERQSLIDNLAAMEQKRDEIAFQFAELQAQHQQLLDRNSALTAQNSEVSPRVAELQILCNDLTAKVAGLETDRSQSSEQFTTLQLERDELSEKIRLLESAEGDVAENLAALEATRDEATQIAASYEAQRDELAQKVGELEAERDELTATINRLESQIHTSQAEWRHQLLDFEARLREQQGSWGEQRAEWSQSRLELEQQRDEVQQKFDLALQDLQRLKGRVAELETELSSRPDSSDADSTELVALRAERDELLRRVEELEHQPTAAVNENSEQELADLQRRFELAVEDLRDYKTKCAKLETELVAANNQTRGGVVDTGGNDWESQKRRLLAALEQHSDVQETPVEKQQRITIEGTIEMTDAVVAEKDRQIAELEARLLAGDSSLAEAERSRKVSDLVDADEVIAEHRERVRQLERDMEEKLRSTELELSIERAKMARQKAELDELKSELDSRKQAIEPTGSVVAPGQPKRRWRDKLGLSGGE